MKRSDQELGSSLSSAEPRRQGKNNPSKGRKKQPLPFPWQSRSKVIKRRPAVQTFVHVKSVCLCVGWPWCHLDQMNCPVPHPVTIANENSSKKNLLSHCRAVCRKSQQSSRRLQLLALFQSPSGGGLTKMGSVTFWAPFDTSFLFAQIVGARWPQKTSVFGPQNLALCEVLGSKCDKNKCGKHSGKFVKLVFAR